MSKFQDAMRRVITGDDLQGQSVIVIDGGPSSEIGKRDLGGHACAHLSERRPNGWVAAPLSAILQSSHHFRYRVSGIKERKATDFI